MDTLLNELHGPAGPWIGGFFAAWGVSLIAISLWFRGASRQSPPNAPAPPPEGHIGVLYYPNGPLVDASGKRLSPSDMARQWARDVLEKPGILCLPKDVFHYETHPLPGRIECVPIGERETEPRVRLEDQIQMVARRQGRLEQELVQERAATTKILAGVVDLDQRLCALQEQVGKRPAKDSSKTFEGSRTFQPFGAMHGRDLPPVCGEPPSVEVHKNQAK